MKKPDIMEMEVTVGKQSEQLYNNKLLHDKVAAIFGAGGATEVMLLANSLRNGRLGSY
jgi:hypothetical protein